MGQNICVYVYLHTFMESKIVVTLWPYLWNWVNCFTEVRGREEIKIIFNIKKNNASKERKITVNVYITDQLKYNRSGDTIILIKIVSL